VVVSRGRAAGPDGQLAGAKGHRQACALLHERRTIGTGEGLPGQHVRTASRRCHHRGVWASGIRLSELAGIRCGDLDLETREIKVLGKGRKERIVKIDYEAARRVDRYLRVRASHEQASRSWLWLGVSNRGPVSATGIYEMVKRRGKQAGVHVYPHRFRHHFSHTWLDRGGPEGDLMELNGWVSPQMLTRYGASARAARARRTYDRIMNGEP
jgi:integrase/recombinase XerD